MKLFGRTFASLLVVVVSFAAMAHSQTFTWVLKVNIPFEFNVGDKTFPAGDYSLVQPLQHFLVLRDARGQSVASAFTHGVQSTAPVEVPKLRFYTVDDRHFLSEVWQQDDRFGQQLPKSKHSTELAKQPSVQTETIVAGSQP